MVLHKIEIVIRKIKSELKKIRTGPTVMNFYSLENEVTK